MYNARNKMQQENNSEIITPTLHQLVRGLGKRTNVINDTIQRLADQGHTFSKSAIYTTINRNGANNPTIEAALLDAIEAEKAKKVTTTARRQALAA